MHNIMKKLELKHLAPYLPYEVWGYFPKEKYQFKIKGIGYSQIVDNELIITDTYDEFRFEDVKPILRPLSDLKKREFALYIPSKCDFDLDFDTEDLTGFNFIELLDEMNFLFEHHFDVFGLIEKGLAIDINTL